MNTTQMPFKPEDYSLNEKIGYGGANNVYLLQSNKKSKESFVLKTNNISGGVDDRNTMLGIAKEQKSEYERIRSVYGAIEGLIPQEFYTILQGPRNSEPVVAMIQPFISGNIRDIFQDFEPEELKSLLRRNKTLMKQVKGFVKATKSDPELINSELDLLGENNLSIVGEGGKERLLFLDPHFRIAEFRSPQIQRKIEERFDYLSQLSEDS